MIELQKNAFGVQLGARIQLQDGTYDTASVYYMGLLRPPDGSVTSAVLYSSGDTDTVYFCFDYITYVPFTMTSAFQTTGIYKFQVQIGDIKTDVKEIRVLDNLE
jgi:hypothetical protein